MEEFLTVSDLLKRDGLYDDITTILQNAKTVGKFLQGDLLEKLTISYRENDTTIRKLKTANLTLRNEIRELKTNEQNAVLRGTDYKLKFQKSQTLIEEMHEKNRSLSERNKEMQKKIKCKKSEEIILNSDHPFFESKTKSKMIQKHIVLEPDTCQVETCEISKDYQEEPMIDPDKTMFVKPLTPIPREKPNKDEVPLTKHKKNDVNAETTIDLDETTFDDFPSSPVINKSKKGSTKDLTPKNSSYHEIPIIDLSGDDDDIKMSDLNNEKSNFTPVKSISLLNSSCEPSPSILPQHPIFNKTSNRNNPCVDDTFETSLNDLFDKTDGNLETTTAYHEKQNDCHTISKPAIIDFDNDENDFKPPTSKLKTTSTSSLKKSDAKSKRLEALKTRKENTNVEYKNDSNATSTDSLWMNNSFDKVPQKEQVSHKYNNVVRNKDKRENMDGQTCAQCESFYKHLPADRRKEMLRKVCRHKFDYQPPPTPNYYWDVDIPDSLECRERGYIVDETDMSAKPSTNRKRRRRPLDAKFKTAK